MKKYYKSYNKGLLYSLAIHFILLFFLLVSIETTVRKESLPQASGEIVQATLIDSKPQEIINFKANEPKIVKLEKHTQPTIEKEIEQHKEKEMEKEEQEKKKVEQEKKKEEKKIVQKKNHEKNDDPKKTDPKKDQLKKVENKKDKLSNISQNQNNNLKINQKKGDSQNQNFDGVHSQLQNIDSQKLATEIEKYDALMREKINQYWVRPPGLGDGLVCELYARLLPDGSVINPEIKVSSGSVAFDEAAISALQKASPLPMPNDPNIMDEFRHFNFKFVPPEES